MDKRHGTLPVDEEAQVRDESFICFTHSIAHSPSTIVPAHLQPLPVVPQDTAIFVTEQPAHLIKVTTAPN